MIWLYDGSWDGFLSAVFAVYKRNDPDDMLRAADRLEGASLFETRFVETDPAHADRLTKGMLRLSSELPEACYQAFLSELPGAEEAILATLRTGFEHGKNPLPLLQIPAVKTVAGLSRKVGWETQLFRGIIRFVETEDNLFVSDIEPEYHILPLLGDHFYARFGDQRLLLRDTRRREAIVSEPKRGWMLIGLPDGPLPPLPRGGAVEELWRRYFEAIANQSRLNAKLQQKFIPLRYRKHITEFRRDT